MVSYVLQMTPEQSRNRHKLIDIVVRLVKRRKERGIRVTSGDNTALLRRGIRYLKMFGELE